MTSLSINTNLMALDIGRSLQVHSSRLSEATHRLSTGLRMNTAADDAAGLAIRELMRADIAAEQQGIRNANDAISMIQTADGALAVIDEKLIRMKELAEQAATGTYDSTQRMLINQEFQAMGAEIDRIARATEFNGIHLLDGSLSGEHDGSGLSSTGKMKIHFGAGNDSAEDYYYMEIGDCTLAGLGLAVATPVSATGQTQEQPGGQIEFTDGTRVAVNDFERPAVAQTMPHPGGIPPTTIQETMWVNDWCWSCGTWTGFGFLHVIPAGTKNVMFNITGVSQAKPDNGAPLYEDKADNDIELFTMDGVHLAGTPLDDLTYTIKNYYARPEYNTGRLSEVSNIESYSPWLGFTEADYDGSNLNSGPADYETGEVNNSSLKWTNYNGMRIGYSGDGNRNGDGDTQEGFGYELLVIDGEVTEDLLIWVPGNIDATMYKMYWDGGPRRPATLDDALKQYGDLLSLGASGIPVSVETQEKAQRALEQIDEAVVRKDAIRAHLGAMQNRLENTVTNLQNQAENLQTAESRISDVDVSQEMSAFVNSQLLTQAASAMLSQANSMPRMLAELLQK